MLISEVYRQSAAEAAGLVPGDELISIDGHEIRDVLDFKFYSYNPRLSVKIRRDGEEHTLKIRKDEGEELGVSTGDFLMDRPKHCANHCVFCFIDQNPKGMRDTIYFKDDDERMSFLMGNYITLTNLTKRDLDRICEMRISPVNVSVHATDPELRRRMLGNPGAGRLYELMERLSEAHISMNCQIVLCPGWNDGAQLERTLRDLIRLYPAVASVSIVPVGLTEHREGLCELRPVTREDALSVIDIAGRNGADCLAMFGTRLIFCADEFYLKAGLPIPEPDYYEDYPQLENGVGLMASLEDEVRLAAPDYRGRTAEPFSVATGVLAAPFICKMLDILFDSCNNNTVYAIENDFFGRSVTVAGLLTGRDILKQLRGKPLGSRLLIPGVTLRDRTETLLDDMTVTELSRELGVPVIPVPNDGAAFAAAVFGDEF